MKSENLLRLLAVAKRYQERPSALLEIDDPYTAYCFDEACLYIQRKREIGDEPTYRHKATFEELYGPLP